MSIKTPILALFLSIFITLGHGKEPSKISGGEYAVPFTSDFVVSLRIQGVHICGGTLIDTRHVLTTGSCVKIANNVLKNNIYVLVGSYELNNPNNGRVYGVTFFITHPDFDKDTMINDIAILTLTPPVFHRPHEDMPPPSLAAQLPFENLQPNTVGHIAGWGSSNPNSETFEPFLKQSLVTVISRQQCEATYGSIYAEEFCVVNTSPGSIFSTGDTGGPFTVYNNGQYVVHGIMLKNAGTGTGPGICLEIYPYMTWIMDIVGRY